jgi:hypothetical protein
MASKAPPVPRDQQSNKIRGASSPLKPEVARDPAGGNAAVNLKGQGRYGGVYQNIVHQGRQQDR